MYLKHRSRLMKYEVWREILCLLNHFSKLKFYLFIRLLQKVVCSGYLHQHQII